MSLPPFISPFNLSCAICGKPCDPKTCARTFEGEPLHEECAIPKIMAHKLSGSHMSTDLESAETILALLKQLEATLLGLRQLRGYVGKGPGLMMVELLVEEGEKTIAEVKNKLMQ